jgi:ornithine cyclodeaminase
VCRIESARVYSRSSANREAFAAELGPELGVELRPAESAASATAAADMVLCATQTGGEVALTASEAGPALYISSVSSTLPMQRELDGPVIASAGIVVIDTPDTLRESGDLLAAVESGLDPNRAVLLSDFLSDPAADARPPVVYKSIGSVEQDLALATAVFAEAQRRGVGDRVDPVEVPRL